MIIPSNDKDKKKIADLEEKLKNLKNELSKFRKSKKNKDPSILNDQFSEEINLEKLKEDK